MTADAQQERAAEVVRAAQRGDLGPVGRDLVALFATAAEQGTRAQRAATYERDKRRTLEDEANALAAVVADLLDGKNVDDVVDDLPHDARRRVLAYRHQTTPLLGGFAPRDQFGPLPKVPPRASVMRERVRTIDHDDTTERKDT